MSDRFCATSNYSFIERFWNVDLRDQPILVGLIVRKIERAEFSSLPIGRITKRITQAINAGI